MTMTILEAKEQVSQVLLGTLGVHAVGRRSDVILLYFHAAATEGDIAEGLAAARDLAGNYKVEARVEEPAFCDNEVPLPISGLG